MKRSNVSASEITWITIVKGSIVKNLNKSDILLFLQTVDKNKVIDDTKIIFIVKTTDPSNLTMCKNFRIDLFKNSLSLRR